VNKEAIEFSGMEFDRKCLFYATSAYMMTINMKVSHGNYFEGNTGSSSAKLR
jgi:hypothetical protein